MIYVLPFILALCGLAFWNRRQWKAEKKVKPSLDVDHFPQ